jgi:hypothetical protein
LDLPIIILGRNDLRISNDKADEQVHQYERDQKESDVMCRRPEAELIFLDVEKPLSFFSMAPTLRLLLWVHKVNNEVRIRESYYEYRPFASKGSLGRAGTTADIIGLNESTHRISGFNGYGHRLPGFV